MRENIDIRIRRLERVDRLLVFAILAVMLTFAVGSTSGDGGDHAVQARRFELVDAAGAVQAVLGTDEEGSTGLFIHDQAGVVRLSLTHDVGQSALFVSDAEGTVRIGVAQFAHGGGGVALHGEGSRGATVLYHKGAGSLAFYDDEGNVTERLPEQ